MNGVPFAKGQALGNDYLVVDAAELPWPMTPARARAFCDRHYGAGSDGVLVGYLDEDPIRLQIFNPDGSEAEKSGNGLRIFAAYLFGRGVVTHEPFQVRLARDQVTMQVETADRDGVLQVVVDIGRPSFRGESVGFRPVQGEALGVELELEGGETAVVNVVSLGNPHCVVFVDELRRDDFLRRAPQLVGHPAFAHGTNVQFARIAGPDRIEAWIYERGVGETLASGSSASAVAAAALRLGLVESRELTVEMRGGEVRIEAGDDGALRLRGPAQIVYTGHITPGAAAAWGRLD
ncbi:MAG TPA: diaminopimelate epimerase [Longimicrobiales bacterium]|nr:diaminopimelate epimerase [Longimicrobiales bacterium]